MLIRPSDTFDYSRIVQCLKRHSTRAINWVPGNASEGAICESRLRSDFREFSPLIRDLELRIIRARVRFIFKNNIRKLPTRFRWQKSFHDHYCRGPKDFVNHLAYIAGNPAKHNLPRGWPYIFTNLRYETLLDINDFFE